MASMVRPAISRQQAALTSRAATAATAPAAPRVSIRPRAFDALRATTSTFHTTSRKCILPAPPQTVIGTVNDPAPVPPPSASHGSYHWTFERLLAGGLVPLTVAPFAAGSVSPVLDAVFCAAILIHSHLGFQSVIIDYIPTKRFPLARKTFWWGLNAATATVGLALYEFETNDVGLTEAIKRIWKA